MNDYDLKIKETKSTISKLYDFTKKIYTKNISETEKYSLKLNCNNEIELLKKELKDLKENHSNSKEHYLNYYNANKDKIIYKKFFEDKFKDESTHLKYSWGRFVYQILKNPYVKKYKIAAQKRKCPYCNVYINKEVYNLHHRTYNYLCMNDKFIDTKDGSVFPLIPDCENCFLDNPIRFKDCMSKIDYLHQSCHNRVHGIEEKIPSTSLL